MASATLAPYKTNALTQTFTLVSTSAEESIYRVSGRGLAQPWSLSISRKIGVNGQKSNDRVSVKISKVNINSTTSLLSAANVSMECSIPRDTVAVPATEVVECLGILASLLNDSTALAATTANRTAIVEGRDL